MSFVYPNFLWALFILLIPIIIHLFNFRRYKTVYFTRVDLLKEVIEDSKSGSKLKHLLVLFSRILALTALVFAFAQPFIPTSDQANTENITSIYIDNSFSMQAIGNDGDLLNECKNKAIDLVRSLNENEKINLLTSDLLSKDQRFYSKSDIIERIKEIDYSPNSTNLSQATSLQIDILNQKSEEKMNQRLFIFSDFQKSTTDIEELSQNNIQTFIYHTKSQISTNILIDSVWFESPVQMLNSPVDLFFRIRNYSDAEEQDLTIFLELDGSEKGRKTVSIPPNSYVEESISYTHLTSGIKKGKLYCKTNQLHFDDSFYFTYEIKNNVSILIIKEDNATNLEQLYSLNNYYQYKSVLLKELKQEDILNQQLIICQNINKITSGTSDLLNKALKNGSTIVLIPGKNIDLNTWNGFLNENQQTTFSSKLNYSQEISYFNSEDPLYKGVFEQIPKNYKNPKTFSHYPLKSSSKNNYITLFGHNASEPFLIYSKQKNGRIFIQSSSISKEDTDFQNHALFATTYLRIAETSSLEKNLYYTIGKVGNYPLNKEIDEKNQIHVIRKEDQTDFIPSLINTNQNRQIVFDHIDGNIKSAGFYQLTNSFNFEDDIAFNYNRKESDISCYSSEEVIQKFTDNGWANVQNLEFSKKGEMEINNLKPKEYWRILLILSLLFFAFEIALLKLWKT